MIIKKIEYFTLNNFLLNSFSTPNILITLPEFLLNIAYKATYVVHRSLQINKSNNSQFINSTKNKGEVRGGGRKPWKQKGSGRARVGSNRSPLWRGGGITFGPKPRVVYKKVNKKEKQLVLHTLIYNKSNKFIVFDNFNFFNFKTNLFAKIFITPNKKEVILIISEKSNKNLQFSIQNCPNVQYILASQLNIVELAKSSKVILDRISLKLIQKRYHAKR